MLFSCTLRNSCSLATAWLHNSRRVEGESTFVGVSHLAVVVVQEGELAGEFHVLLFHPEDVLVEALDGADELVVGPAQLLELLRLAVQRLLQAPHFCRLSLQLLLVQVLLGVQLFCTYSIFITL